MENKILPGAIVSWNNIYIGRTSGRVISIKGNYVEVRVIRDSIGYSEGEVMIFSLLGWVDSAISVDVPATLMSEAIYGQ